MNIMKEFFVEICDKNKDMEINTKLGRLRFLYKVTKDQNDILFSTFGALYSYNAVKKRFYIQIESKETKAFLNKVDDCVDSVSNSFCILYDEKNKLESLYESAKVDLKIFLDN